MAVYKYRVEAKKAAPRQGSKLLGTASLNIAGQFKVTGIQIWQGKGGKPFVSMPSYKSNEAGANGKPVYKQLFHAIGADQKQVDANGKPMKNEVQELLNNSVLKAYEKSSEIPGHPGEYAPGRYDYSPEVDLEAKLSAIVKTEETPLKITARMTAVPERNGMLGYGSIRVGDFQLNSVQYRVSAENPANRYAAMPSYSVLKDGKPAYHNVGYPVTKECSSAVREAVQEAFEYSQQHQAEQTTEENPFSAESQESSFSAEKGEQKAETLQEQTDQETRKYEFTGETKTVPYGSFGSVTLHRIRAVADFGDVKAGQLGGWIESEHRLSQKGNAFVYDEAQVYPNAHVEGNAQIREKALIYGNAYVYGDAKISGNAEVYGYARICGEMVINGNTHVCGETVVSENTVAISQQTDAVSRRKEIRQDIRANGFKANDTLVKQIERVDALTGKHNSLRDIKELTKAADISAEAQEAVNEAVGNLQQQEVKMQAPEPPAVEPA